MLSRQVCRAAERASKPQSRMGKIEADRFKKAAQWRFDNRAWLSDPDYKGVGRLPNVQPPRVRLSRYPAKPYTPTNFLGEPRR